MKNFRKVLALILVVATVFSFVAMTSAREVGDYTDYDKVSYQEAVDVLTAIGILDGYTDGSFKPADTIAREEMAKMVAVLSNAGDDISELYASACKFADTKDRWSASYVAYCNETGIVAGRNATTFDPRGNVTGIETAKMLLCLIGFDATAQGYVGTNWKTNVLRDAKNIGLLNGFAADYDIAKAITREEAAQMMLNALKAPMVVGTLSNNLVTITNNVWVTYVDTNGKLVVGTKLTLTDAEKQYDCYVLYGNVVVSNIPVWTNYKGLSVNETNAQDCYGNPVVEWVYESSKGVKIWSAQYATTPDFSATVAVDFEDVLEDELDSRFKYDVTVYVDGTIRDKWDDVSLTDKSKWLDDLADIITGKGVLTQIFVDDAHRDVIITVKNTYIGKVDAVSNLGGKFILEDKTYGLNVFDNTDYGFKADDIVLYWMCSKGDYNGDYQLHDAKLVTPVTGLVERTEVASNMTSSTAKVAGKTYEYAKNFATEYAVDNNRDEMSQTEVTNSTKNDVEYDVYLDEYGYIMGWAEHVVKEEVNYAYLIEDSNYANNAGLNSAGVQTYSYFGDYVDFTAKTNADVAIDKATYEFMVASNNWDDAQGNGDLGRLVSYVMKDGKLSMKDDAEWAPTGSYLDEDGDLHDLDSRVELITGTYNTKYLVRTWDQSKRELVYNVYSYDELPSSLVAGRSSKVTNIQYFYETKNGVDLLTYVFIDAVYTLTAEHAFVTSYKATISDAIFVDGVNGDEYEGYNAIINGKEAIFAVEGGIGADYTAKGDFWLYETVLSVIGVTDNGTPIYRMVKEVEPTDYDSAMYYGGKLVMKESGVTFDGGTSLKIAEDCVVVIGDKSGDDDVAKVLGSIEELNNYLETYHTTSGTSVKYYDMDEIWVVMKDNEVSELFINVDSVTITTP